MRINPDYSSDVLYALSKIEKEQEGALQQISSGRRVTLPSDDPAAMGLLVRNRSQLALNDQFSEVVAALKTKMQMADSTLGSVVTAMERAVSLGVQGATNTESQADRSAIAAEMKGIRDNILALANTSLDGVYLFSGTEIHTAPFQSDMTAPTGVTYQGGSDCANIAIGNDCFLKAGIPGDQIFLSNSGNTFGALNNLISALGTNDNDAISNATSELRSAFDQVRAKRVFFGNALSEIEGQGTILSNDRLDLSSEENRLGAADLAESISSLLNAQTARNATLSAFGKITRVSLIDYLE